MPKPTATLEVKLTLFFFPMNRQKEGHHARRSGDPDFRLPG